MEGYGLTETSPVVSVNRYDEKGRKFGTVGPLIEGVEVKIAEDGEILCKGPNIMMGYYKRPDMTAEVIKDGWFHTGDIGTLVDNKFLKITDRKKELFKTSGGKYVAPMPIENKLKESPFVEQVMIVGPERKYVGALIVLSFPNLKDWCRQNGINYNSNEEIIRHPKVIEMIKELVESFNTYFNHVEQIKKFQLLPNEWTVDGGELTPTLKLKRKVIMEKYRDILATRKPTDIMLYDLFVRRLGKFIENREYVTQPGAIATFMEQYDRLVHAWYGFKQTKQINKIAFFGDLSRFVGKDSAETRYFEYVFSTDPDD